MDFTALIPIAGGVFGLLAATGVVRVSKDAQANEQWVQKYGSLIKVISPLLIVFGLAQLFGMFR